MLNDFTPFYDLWTTTDSWKVNMTTWVHDDFEKIDAVIMEETVENAMKTLGKIQKVFRNKDLNKILKICENMKEQVQDFAPKVPMVMAMRTDGIKDRHWESISNKVGFEVKPFEGFNLQNVFDMDLMKWSDEIVDVGDRAGKEYNIECSLAKMKAEWEDVFFNLKAFKMSGTSTVTGFDDAWGIVDEHSVLTQTMQFSSFKGPFIDEIDEWNEQLLYVSNVLEEWQKCQGNWAYLQPIFDSQDIMKQLPGESRKFKGVDKMWREIINGTKATPNVLKACTRTLKDDLLLLNAFKKCNDELDRVQRGLKDYIEEKCAVFARFYFLSQDDLLEILSQTKEVKNVRPHLKKVFENMHDLEFQPDLTITAMYSAEKECIQLNSPVDPKDKLVENWMGEIEQMMFDSIRYVLKYSVEDYLVRKRTEWILNHSGQCVLNGSQVHWTSELEIPAKELGMPGVIANYEMLS